METYFADLHIHIGRAGNNRPVKITSSRNLTFNNIITECTTRKGIDIAGIVDCASPPVIFDIERLIEEKDLVQLEEGGLRHRKNLTIILGSEIETREKSGGISHNIAYFPFLSQIKNFSKALSKYIKNIELSSQRASLTAFELLSLVKNFGGILVPAHVFTPHKSLYGNAANRLKDLFYPHHPDEIIAVELGLSADTYLGDYIKELETKAFLSNSDAHSLPKIAREYNKIKMQRANFQELVFALKRLNDRAIIANYGLDPKLGKYHRTCCNICGHITSDPPCVDKCYHCPTPHDNITKGVLDRIWEIKDCDEPIHPSHRPVYNYQIPLEFVPGVGKIVLNHLINTFGSEMNVLHRTEADDLKKAVGWKVANNIILARDGLLKIQSGGGGTYGKVVKAPKDEPEGQLTLF